MNTTKTTEKEIISIEGYKLERHGDKYLVFSLTLSGDVQMAPPFDTQSEAEEFLDFAQSFLMSMKINPVETMAAMMKWKGQQ